MKLRATEKGWNLLSTRDTLSFSRGTLVCAIKNTAVVDFGGSNVPHLNTRFQMKNNSFIAASGSCSRKVGKCPTRAATHGSSTS